MANAVDDALIAAGRADGERFDGAVTALGRLDREQLGVLLGTMTALTLERTFPDGLDSDDATDLLDRAERAASSWYRETERDALTRALIGALGIAEDDDGEPVPRGPSVVTHGLLLLAELLSARPGELSPLIGEGLRELHRAQTVELP